MRLVLALLIGLIALNSCIKQNDRPEVIVLGHGGMSLHTERTIYPSNSLESILYTSQILGTEGVEVDVQLTKDSVLVLYHDLVISESNEFSGCIGNYNWDEIKSLTLENSKYKIVDLKSVLDQTITLGKVVYFDLKTYNSCLDLTVDYKVLARALEKLINQYSAIDQEFIIIGSLSNDLLKNINFKNKCFEHYSVEIALEKAKLNNYNYVLFHADNITKLLSNKLSSESILWGLFGGKSNGEIKNMINLNPNFVITDNISYTLKLTK